MTEGKSEQELCIMLNDKLRMTNSCGGLVITGVRETNDDSWEFEIPSGTTVPCRSAIIREQAALKMRYHLTQID